MRLRLAIGTSRNDGQLLCVEMNLVQAKKFVESAPGVVRKDVSKDEAEKLKKALQAQGATIELE